MVETLTQLLHPGLTDGLVCAGIRWSLVLLVWTVLGLGIAVLPTRTGAPRRRRAPGRRRSASAARRGPQYRRNSSASTAG